VPSDKAAQDHARMAQQQHRPTDLPRHYQEMAQRFRCGPRISHHCQRTL
jgi:hypothetical protein